MKQDQRDDGDILSRKAFVIEKTKAELVNGVPVSGEDYLLMVRQQAASCIQTSIAPPPTEIRQLNLPFEYQFTKDIPTNTNVLSDQAWQTLFDSCFKRFRKERQNTKHLISATPFKSKSNQELHIFCTTCEMDDTTLLDTIAPLPQKIIFRLLNLNKEWLQSAMKNSPKDTSVEATTSTLSSSSGERWKCHTLWLFALLVYVDPVLTSKDISILRDVCRVCIDLRNSCEGNSDQVIQLNIIITIISKCFGQSDLQ